MATNVHQFMTAKGYTRRTPEEIREAIIAKQKEMNPNFEKLELDVQANLIDTAISKISQYENILEAMFNAYSIDGSNDFFFKQMGEELGLRMKNAYNAQVVLQFKGLAGDIIPPYTKVKDATGHYVFETQERKVIDTTGIVNIVAYGESDSIVPANRLNLLVSVLSDGISVTNPQPSMEKIEEESFEEFRLRAQARLRSPRLGGRLYAESLLKSIDGVDPRLVNFIATDYTRQYDPQNPELELDELTDEEKEPPKPQEENTEIPWNVIAKINLVNEGETRPDIVTLQEYVESKWGLSVSVVDMEFVHLYNNDGVNNYIYWDQHWYEVKFKKKSEMDGDYITSLGYQHNIEALDYTELPNNTTNSIFYCNKPGDKIGFYESRDEEYVCYLGKEIVIDETNKPVVNNYIKIVGIDAIVGGGDEYQIALALYQAFFETQKLLSRPSGNEIDRTVKVSLGLYNSTFPIVFTRPKLLELNLKLQLATLDKSMSALAIQKATITYLTNAINSLKVGRPVVMNQLNQIIQPGFLDIDLQPYEVKEMKWLYDIGQFKDANDEEADDSEKADWKEFDTDNKIPVIFNDCYCVLVRYEVEILGG